ncbi:acylneuraminate cytidylyltransferase [Hymenobacter sp. DH14]|uniref:Acylneuraminate cytidylyltransferase n=1 Tax=Hymenobacter cyanobacteriorum TaxID=2926463 RepID=A0A9X2AGL9_9BACT|nr:acylneuraminate cytidylyltransferase [Hymenobacter cyanobacteriorum]MCI1185919.1 acylneuraminate cytidylyltransferase [Hymenobacter cyanobacteriorum]
MQKAGIISQVRMGSTRLPGKVLLAAASRPLLDYHVARLAQSGLPLYLATTTEPADDALATYAETQGLPYHRGSETDVLARYYETAVKFGLDVVVRVTSDCPLVDGPLIGAAVARYLADADPLEFRSNSIIRSFPRGLDFEIFSMAMLTEAYERAATPYEREHVTPYLKTGPAAHRFRNVDEVWPGGDFSGFRITLDTPEDYKVLRRLIEEHRADQLALSALLALLEAHPEIMALNASVEQKTT